MMSLFLLLGLFLFLLKKGGILSWMLNLEILVISLVLMMTNVPFLFIISLVMAVCSACVVLVLFVFCLVENNLKNTWSFFF